MGVIVQLNEDQKMSNLTENIFDIQIFLKHTFVDFIICSKELYALSYLLYLYHFGYLTVHLKKQTLRKNSHELKIERNNIPSINCERKFYFKPQ